jgi:hypothetical protein
MTHNRHIVLEIRELYAWPVAAMDRILEDVIEIVAEITLCGIQSITASDRIRRPILRLRDPFMIKSTLTPRASLKSC